MKHENETTEQYSAKQIDGCLVSDEFFYLHQKGSNESNLSEVEEAQVRESGELFLTAQKVELEGNVDQINSIPTQGEESYND